MTMSQRPRGLQYWGALGPREGPSHDPLIVAHPEDSVASVKSIATEARPIAAS
jgi:hypothetical protein